MRTERIRDRGYTHHPARARQHPLKGIGPNAPAGNLAMQRLLRGGNVHPGLEVGDVHAHEEHEADRIADHIVSGETKRAGSSSDGAIVLRREGGRPHNGILHGRAFGKSVGKPLDAQTRDYFEPHFGDLSTVRVHEGKAAAATAAAIDARAYTVGTDIGFASGEYAPSTHEGRRLIAHELMHVIQQAHGSVPVIQRQSSEGPERRPRSLSASLIAQTMSDPDLADEIDRIHVWQAAHPGGADDYQLALDLIQLEYEAAARQERELRHEQHEEAVARVVEAVNAGRIPKWMKVFPFLPSHGLGALLPWDWEFDAAPIMAHREGKTIIVQQPFNTVRATARFNKDTRTLPADVFSQGLSLNARELVGVRLYDEGEKVVVIYAEDLLKFADASDKAVWKNIAITALSVGGGMVAGKAVQGFWAARAGLASEAAFASAPLATRVLVQTATGATLGGSSSGLGSAAVNLPDLIKGKMSGSEYVQEVGSDLASGAKWGAVFGGGGEAVGTAFSKAFGPRSPMAPAGAETPSRTALATTRQESLGARSSARPSAAAQAAISEAERIGFLSPQGPNVATGTAQTSRSIVTGVRANVAESMGYEARLARGELGILAPSGSNVAGADYATAARLPSGEFEIIVSDMKSRASEGSAFGRAPSMLTQSWQDEVQDALAPGRLNFGDPTVEQGIRDAWAEGRIRIVRDTVDFSIRGQGALKLGN